MAELATKRKGYSTLFNNTSFTNNANNLSVQIKFEGDRVPVDRANEVTSGRGADEHPHQQSRKDVHEELHDERTSVTVF